MTFMIVFSMTGLGLPQFTSSLCPVASSNAAIIAPASNSPCPPGNGQKWSAFVQISLARFVKPDCFKPDLEFFPGQRPIVAGNHNINLFGVFGDFNAGFFKARTSGSSLIG